jgi:signal transduction histidine kinase
MAERALLLGGRLDIQSAPAVGTAITAELPCNHPGE